MILVSNRASAELGKKIASCLGIKYTEMTKRQFADGEWYHAFPLDVSGQALIIVAASINVVIPYLGYSTMERAKPHSLEIPKGITRTRQIYRARPNFVAFFDLHSEAVLHAHAGEIRTTHIWSENIVARKIRETGIENYVLVSPDYGFSKRVARLASALDCPHTAADKDRYDHDKTIVGQISSVVQGKTAIVCDDMIRTGGSILQTAQRCLDAGAIDVMVMATHLVMAGDARERLQNSPISRVIGSDSYPGVESDGLLDIYSVSSLIAETLKQYLKV